MGSSRGAGMGWDMLFCTSLLASDNARKRLPSLFFTKRKRSEQLSRIRGTGNKATELLLILIFRTHGITGWRRGSKLSGKQDFVFTRLRVAVFVDGCFWHGCPMHTTHPTTNAGFWRRKSPVTKGGIAA